MIKEAYEAGVRAALEKYASAPGVMLGSSLWGMGVNNGNSVSTGAFIGGAGGAGLGLSALVANALKNNKLMGRMSPMGNKLLIGIPTVLGALGGAGIGKLVE
jgi:hypothetical protein